MCRFDRTHTQQSLTKSFRSDEIGQNSNHRTLNLPSPPFSPSPFNLCCAIQSSFFSTLMLSNRRWNSKDFNCFFSVISSIGYLSMIWNLSILRRMNTLWTITPKQNPWNSIQFYELGVYFDWAKPCLVSNVTCTIIIARALHNR